MWTCPLCAQRNRLPSYYENISAQELPAELHPGATTIDYAMPSASDGIAPAYVLVVDLCLREDELAALKEALLQLVASLPEAAYVGLVTVGACVHVYELAWAAFPKAHVFEARPWTSAQVQRVLGLGIPLGNDGQIAASIKNRYVLPLREVEATLTVLLEGLQRDPGAPAKADQRPARATGTALQVTLGLLEYTFLRHGARALLFLGGPCTVGPGRIVGLEKKEALRSHHHLRHEQAPHHYAATRFYAELAEQAARQGHAVDVFAASLDQVGLLEMAPLSRSTGGWWTSAESFTQPQFARSLQRITALPQMYSVKLEVKAVRELRCLGAIGHVAPAETLSGKRHSGDGAGKKGSVGVGGNGEWRAAAADAGSTVAIFFGVVSEKQPLAEAGKMGVVQLKTYWSDVAGQRVMRITTLACHWAPLGAAPSTLLEGFDQEAAASVAARLATWRATQGEEDAGQDALRWLDAHLITFTRRYAHYRPRDETSYTMPPAMALYPTFLFHLRRSQLVSLFGQSPDETAYCRHWLWRESVAHTLTMLQPALDAYAFELDEPQPVSLAAASLRADAILVLDTFFHVVLWRGTTIAAWRDAGYAEQVGYESFKALLAAPEADVARLLSERFPFPLYVQCDQGTSQARYLLAVVDPQSDGSASNSNGQGAAEAAGGQHVFTEDASLHKFLDHLRKYAVLPEDANGSNHS